MSKRTEARAERIASARVAVAEVARLRPIAQTQSEINSLAESFVANAQDKLLALMATERGRELATRNRGQPLRR